MRLRKIAAASTAALLALWTVLEPLPVLAQTQQPPQVQTVNPTDLFQDVVNGIPQAGNQYASALTLAGYNGSLPARANALVGGDATTSQNYISLRNELQGLGLNLNQVNTNLKNTMDSLLQTTDPAMMSGLMSPKSPWAQRRRFMCPQKMPAP